MDAVGLLLFVATGSVRATWLDHLSAVTDICLFWSVESLFLML
jgi:hypothetical protein